jgi:RimJ/RimL family protein N-acetyltransferase
MPVPRAVEWPREQPTLEGQRVRLRPWRQQDVDAVCEACQDAGIQRWTTVPTPYRSEHAHDFVTQVAPLAWDERSGALFCIAGGSDSADSTDSAVLGSIGLVSVDLDLGAAELGYWVAPAARGRGVATMAGQRLIEWALGAVGFRVVYLHVDPANTPSLRVAERLGRRVETSLRGLGTLRAQGDASTVTFAAGA